MVGNHRLLISFVKNIGGDKGPKNARKELVMFIKQYETVKNELERLTGKKYPNLITDKELKKQQKAYDKEESKKFIKLRQELETLGIPDIPKYSYNPDIDDWDYNKY